MKNFTTDPLREYFRKNGFYSYLLESHQINNRIIEQYDKVASNDNKRNLHLKKFWKDIKSYGKNRRVIALDLGGTNLNIYDIEVKTPQTAEVIKTITTDFYEEKIYTPEILFEDLRKQLDLFILSSSERDELQDIVFIFSYPIEQIEREDGYIDAIVAFLNKTRKHERIIGMQIGIEFQEYLRKNGYPHVKICVTNDAPIYCLAAKTYEIENKESFDAAMNIIVGTGTNISTAYDEEGSGLTVINTEFGDFNIASLSKFDKIFDEQCEMPARYLNEKMISGAWMRHIYKIIIKDLIDQKIIPTDLLKENQLNLKASQIESIIAGQTDATKEQITIIEFVWRELNKRGGTICGITIAHILEQLRLNLNKEVISVIVMETGSVISKGYRFREHMIDAIDSTLGKIGSMNKINYKIASINNQAAHGAIIFQAFFTQ
jgi:hexokinase